jgi:hypothetical protein
VFFVVKWHDGGMVGGEMHPNQTVPIVNSIQIAMLLLFKWEKFKKDKMKSVTLLKRRNNHLIVTEVLYLLSKS